MSIDSSDLVSENSVHMKNVFVFCCFEFQNMTSWTVKDTAPNVKPDVIHFAVSMLQAAKIIRLKCNFLKALPMVVGMRRSLNKS